MRNFADWAAPLPPVQQPDMGNVRQHAPTVTGEPGEVNQVKAWSISVLYWYELCPARYYWEKIKKLPTKPKDYFAKGNRIHKSVETYVKSRGGTVLDKDVKHNKTIIKECAEFEGAPVMIEQEWGFGAQWQPVGWFDKDVRFRCKLDWLVDYGDSTAEGVDWKSGKPRDSYADEMEVFAMATFHRLPHIKSMEMRLVYVESPHQFITAYHRRNLELMTAKWEMRANHLFNETRWLPRPNDRCRGCDFARSEGGPCRYG